MGYSCAGGGRGLRIGVGSNSDVLATPATLEGGLDLRKRSALCLGRRHSFGWDCIPLSRFLELMC